MNRYAARRAARIAAAQLDTDRLYACLYGYDGVPIGEPEDVPGQLAGHEPGCTGPWQDCACPVNPS
jgi:hypothetical protein